VINFPVRIINAGTGKIEETISENHRGEIDGLLEILPRIAAKVSGGGDLGYDFGQIEVTSNPDGAEIYLDGVKIGVTPSTIENIQTGKHQLKISKSGFNPYDSEIVLAKGVTAAVDVKLKPGYFSLKFSSTPQGADIYLQGIRVGVTPFKTEVRVGIYDLRITMENYKPWEQTLELTRDDSIRAILVYAEEYGRKISQKMVQKVVKPGIGRLEINSPSTTAYEVYINKKYSGMTPLVLSLEAGEYIVEVKNEGIVDYYEKVLLSGDDDIAVKAEFSRHPALIVVSTPDKADVIIDGEEVGQTPFFQSFDAGEHHLEVKKEGFVFYENIMVANDATTEIKAKLETPPTLSVISSPDNADAYLDGNKIGTTPFIGTIAPGFHEILLKMENLIYFDEIEAIPGKVYKINATLEFSPRLEVMSTPNDAAIFLNENELGRTPFIGHLDPGSYNLRLEKENLSYFEKINVEMGKDVSVRAELKPPQTVKITSTPPNADIYIDGIKKDTKSPSDIQLPSGIYQVILKYGEDLVYAETIEVTTKKPVTVTAKLVSVPKINIKSEPTGARVRLDGLSVGNTPLSIIVEIGEHKLDVYDKKGKTCFSHKIKGEMGKVENLNVDFSKLLDVTILTEPKKGIIYINNIFFGISPMTLKLNKGKHKITIASMEQKATKLRSAKPIEEIHDIKESMTINIKLEN